MVNEIHRLSPLPTAVIDGIRHSFDKDPGPEELNAILDRDHQLKQLFYRFVNDSAFGKRHTIGNLLKALSHFGMDRVRATLVSLAFCRHLIDEGAGRGIDVRAFCTHSLSAALIMRTMGRFLNVKYTSHLYWIGLLHDLGRLALDAAEGTDYCELLRRTTVDLAHAERERFGLTSDEEWLRLADQWSFPRELIDLYKGRIAGKDDIETRRLAEAASRMADLVGSPLIQGVQQRRPTVVSETFTLISAEDILDLSQTVQRELEAYGRILNLKTPDPDEILRSLYSMARELSLTNAKCEEVQRKLSFKVNDLEMLAHVFTGIIRSLEGDPLMFSVLESFMEGFQVDGAFMLNSEARGEFSGYAARSGEGGEGAIDLMHFFADDLSPSIRKCIEKQRSVRVYSARDEEMLVRCLGPVSQAWLAPAFGGGRLTSILGIGVREENRRRFNHDFGRILDILAAEIGLSVENTRLYNQMRKEAGMDPVTEISNRRNIMQVLKSEFARFKRKATPLSIAILDLDNFKSINDRHGHLMGDEVLMRTAQILKEGMRESDYIGRYGGDEFIAVFPYTPAEEAVQIVERIRKQVNLCCAGFCAPRDERRLSMSAGVAEADEKMFSFDSLIKAADDALYAAKESGRDQCLVHRSSRT